MKAARTVWSRGKDGDYIKVLPIAIDGYDVAALAGIPLGALPMVAGGSQLDSLSYLSTQYQGPLRLPFPLGLDSSGKLLGDRW